MQRVLVLGPGGAGKSVLSRELASITGLPLVHLDREFWGPDWAKPDQTEWHARLDELMAGEQWIVDGTHIDTIDRRLARADGVVLLDYPRRVAVGGVITRLMRRAGRQRSDLAPGCRNRLDRDYVGWVWTYHRETRPRLSDALDRHADHIERRTLRSRRQTQRWLAELRNKPTRGVIDA